MQPIAYTVGVTFSNSDLVEPFLRWLREGHIAEVRACGAISAELVLLDSPAHSCEIHFRFPTREAFARYERDHAPRLRAEGLCLFPVEKGVQYRRSVGVVCDTF